MSIEYQTVDSQIIESQTVDSQTVESQNTLFQDEQMERLLLPSNIFRYKFSQDFMGELFQFSKIHQYDDRETFKEAWKIWTTDNEEIINEEIEVLKQNNYEGNVLDKMYKSARYYFRKKSTEKKAPKQRREYISANDELLKAMDNHIILKVSEPNYKPKTGFSNFCEENSNIIEASIQKIVTNVPTIDKEEIREKMKKTYKNRYFMLVKMKSY